MAEDKPLPVELPAPALKEAQHRVLRVQAANDRFGAPGHHTPNKSGHDAFPPLSRSGWRRSMAGMGHEQRFPPLRLNVRCRLGQATFIGTDGKGREAPTAVIPAIGIRLHRLPLPRSSCRITASLFSPKADQPAPMARTSAARPSTGIAGNSPGLLAGRLRR
jgi:hypothetical protein